MICNSVPSVRAPWQETRWSVVGDLDRPAADEREQAWAYLADAYREPMTEHARRVLARCQARYVPRGEAEEVVAAFLATCFEKSWLGRANPARGPFRAYVQVLLRRFVYAHLRDAKAQKRHPGPGRDLVPLLESDAVDHTSPETAAENAEFARSWVRTSVELALGRLELEHGRYATVIRDLIRTDGAGSADLAEQMGLKQKQIKVLRCRSRKRFHDLLEDEIASTVADSAQLLEEWRALSPFLP